MNLFTRDLEKLKKEISLYSNQESFWLTDCEITNSGGNLCLHLIGNLKTYIGHGLGKLEYERDREFEFGGKDVSKEQLIIAIDETIHFVNTGLSSLSETDLEKDFPIVIWENKTSMIFTLMHLHSHLNYHLGQINYHRRMLDN